MSIRPGRGGSGEVSLRRGRRSDLRRVHKASLQDGSFEEDLPAPLAPELFSDIGVQKSIVLWYSLCRKLFQKKVILISSRRFSPQKGDSDLNLIKTKQVLRSMQRDRKLGWIQFHSTHRSLGVEKFPI